VDYLRESLAELPALNRMRARRDPDWDPIRDSPALTALLAPQPVATAPMAAAPA
jgi:hypothetical protein